MTPLPPTPAQVWAEWAVGATDLIDSTDLIEKAIQQIKRHGVAKGDYVTVDNKTGNERLDVLATLHHLATGVVPEGDNPDRPPIWLTDDWQTPKGHAIRWACMAIAETLHDVLSESDRTEVWQRVTVDSFDEFDRGVVALWNDLTRTDKRTVLTVLNDSIKWLEDNR